MRCIASVLCVCTLAVLVESAPPVGRVCRVEVPGDGLTMWDALQSREQRCDAIYTGARASEARRANTTEQLRLVFNRACDSGSNFTECLARVRVDAETCLEGDEKNSFILSLGLLQTYFQVECEDSGVRTATIYEKQREFLKPLDKVSRCSLWASAFTMGPPSDRLDNTNRVMFRTYRRLRGSKDCAEGNRGGDQDTLLVAQVAVWSDILDRMKCLNPQDGEEVLCTTIIEAPDN